MRVMKRRNRCGISFVFVFIFLYWVWLEYVFGGSVCFSFFLVDFYYEGL